MTKPEVCRLLGGALVILIGVAMGFGSLQLWNGVPSSWPDVVASNETGRRVSRGILVAAIALMAAGIATLLNLGWGPMAAAVAVIAAVGLAFWANHTLFGSVRPVHAGTNLVLGAVILWLLWAGRSVPGS